MRRHKDTSSATRIALGFFLCAALLVLCGIFLKLALVYASSRFDGQHQFIMQVKEKPDFSEIIAIAPDTKSVTMLQINKDVQGSFGRNLGIPTDVSLDIPLSDTSVVTLAQTLLFHPPHQLPLTIFDRLRIFLFANDIKPTSIKVSELSFPLDTISLDSLLPQLFTDHTLYSENVSVSVVNATGISGVGSKVAKLLSTIGTNVISVSSATDQKTSSLVYYGKPSYTTSRIAQIFGISSHTTSTPMVSDVTLTVGEDVGRKLSF